MDDVWRDAPDTVDRTVDTHVKTLRAKLRAVSPGARPDPDAPRPGLQRRGLSAPVKIGLRIFLGYFLIVGLAGFFVMRVFVDEVKPGVRQAMEDTLVDTANALAEQAAPDLRDGHIATAASPPASTRWRSATSTRASGTSQARVDYRIYVTDARGIVVYDSAGATSARTISRWNDVYLTCAALRRALHPQRPDDDSQQRDARGRADPRRRRRIIGVLTVAKPNARIQPFIDSSRAAILRQGWCCSACPS
jgi:two-component system sensor histidine kinase CreC